MKRPPLRILLLLCMLTIISCDGSIPFTVEITSYSTGMDTVTVTFSDTITDITMPNTISFATGTYRFEITDTDGNAQDIGLLSHTDDTVTIVILGKTASTITGNYSVKIFENEEEDPVELATSEPFAFQAWTGGARDINVYKSNEVNGVVVFIFMKGTATADETDYDNSYFTIFDQEGNNIPIVYEPKPIDSGAHVISFDTSIDPFDILVRFFKQTVIQPVTGEIKP